MEFELEDLSAEELHQLGLKIGNKARNRPDITHRIAVGMRDGLETSGLEPQNFGDILWSLWRHWYHTIVNNVKVHPPIAFITSAQPSGKGKVKD